MSICVSEFPTDHRCSDGRAAKECYLGLEVGRGRVIRFALLDLSFASALALPQLAPTTSNTRTMSVPVLTGKE